MKKVLLLLVLFGLLSVVTPVYASDVDGAWLVSGPGQPIIGLAMLRADGGQLLVTMCFWNDGAMDGWVAFLGPFDGTNGQGSLVLTSQASGGPQSAAGTITLTSATTGTFTFTSCVDFPQQSNCPPVGYVTNFEKLF